MDSANRIAARILYNRLGCRILIPRSFCEILSSTQSSKITLLPTSSVVPRSTMCHRPKVLPALPQNPSYDLLWTRSLGNMRNDNLGKRTLNLSRHLTNHSAGPLRQQQTAQSGGCPTCG